MLPGEAPTVIVSPPRALFEAAQGGNQLADRKCLSLFFLKNVPAVAKRQNARPQLFFDSLKSNGSFARLSWPSAVNGAQILMPASTPRMQASRSISAPLHRSRYPVCRLLRVGGDRVSPCAWLGIPTAIVDLFAEFRNLTNGIPTPCGAGLLGAMSYFGLGGRWRRT